jgi:hypothetical protein
MQMAIPNCDSEITYSPNGKNVSSSNYSVRMLRSPEEVETVRAAWEQWQTHPNTDLDHYLLVCRLRNNVLRPHVIVLSYQNEPHAILVARLEKSHVAPSIGYFKPVQLPVTSLSVLYHGLLGSIDDVVATTMLGALRSTLESGEADVLELSHLPGDSPLLRVAQERTSWWLRDGKPGWSTHWELTLPNQVGGLLQKMSSKHRSWVRRKARDLETTFPGRTSYDSFVPGSDVGALCSELELVARQTYQRGLGEGFMDNAEHRERLALFNRRGALRAWTLRVDNTPRAFCCGFIHRNVFHFAETGYDPDFRSQEVGTLTFLHMVDQLIKEGVAKFDFGFGDAHYKQRFGDKSWSEATLRVYARAPKGLIARSYAGIFDAGTAFGRYVAGRLGVLDRLKTVWRRRLAAKATTKVTEHR